MFFSRTIDRETSKVCRSDISSYISPSALGPVASSQNTALHRLLPGGVPFLTQQEADAHRDNSEQEERSKTFEGTNPNIYIYIYIYIHIFLHIFLTTTHLSILLISKAELFRKLVYGPRASGTAKDKRACKDIVGFYSIV